MGAVMTLIIDHFKSLITNSATHFDLTPTHKNTLSAKIPQCFLNDDKRDSTLKKKRLCEIGIFMTYLVMLLTDITTPLPPKKEGTVKKSFRTGFVPRTFSSYKFNTFTAT